VKDSMTDPNPSWAKTSSSDRLTHHLQKHQAANPKKSSIGTRTNQNKDKNDDPSTATINNASINSNDNNNDGTGVKFDDAKRDRREERARKSHIPDWASEGSDETGSSINENTKLRGGKGGHREGRRGGNGRRYHKPYQATQDFGEGDFGFEGEEQGMLSDGQDQHEYFSEDPPIERTPLHRFFIFYQVLVVLNLCCMCACQVLMIIYKSKMGAVQLTTRVYGAIFAILAIVVESEKGNSVRSSVLMNWCARGFVYSYLGVMGLEESIVVNISKSHVADAQFVAVFVQFSSLGLIVLGGGYFVMGALCLRNVRDRRIAAYKTQVKQRDLRIAMLEEHSLKV